MSIAADPDSLNDDERTVYNQCKQVCDAIPRRYAANNPCFPAGYSCGYLCLREIENSRNK